MGAGGPDRALVHRFIQLMQLDVPSALSRRMLQLRGESLLQICCRYSNERLPIQCVVAIRVSKQKALPARGGGRGRGGIDRWKHRMKRAGQGRRILTDPPKCR